MMGLNFRSANATTTFIATITAYDVVTSAFRNVKVMSGAPATTNVGGIGCFVALIDQNWRIFNL